MKFFELQPEMPGDLGPSTTGDLIARPPKVEHLEFEFNVWPEDCLVEAISTYIVTNALKKHLLGARPTGATFGHVKITKSGFFQDVYPNERLPAFSWLVITGRRGKDDFGMSSRGNLVVSERVLNLIKKFGLRNCEIEDYEEK
jgi:hypothetical protein